MNQSTVSNSSTSSFAELLAAMESKGKCVPVVIDGVKFVDGIYLGKGFVDFGGKCDGIVLANEIPELDLNEGERYRFQVVAPSDEEFDDSKMATLSYFRAQAWSKAQALKDSAGVVVARVTRPASRRGQSHIHGLKATIGEGRTRIGAFLPRSHAGVPSSQLDALVNSDIEVQVLEVDPEKGKLIISQKAIAESRRQGLMDSLEVGQQHQGVVVNVVEFGAFVDIGHGVRGLLHVSECLPVQPKKGDKVLVSVCKLDRESGRIGLSARIPARSAFLAALQPEGSVSGRVTKLADFGAFVVIDEASGTSGLLHASETNGRKLKVGEQLTVRVLRVSVEDGRVALSLRH